MSAMMLTMAPPCSPMPVHCLWASRQQFCSFCLEIQELNETKILAIILLTMFDLQNASDIGRLDTCITVVDSAEFYNNLGSMKTYEQGETMGTIAELMMEQVATWVIFSSSSCAG